MGCVLVVAGLVVADRSWRAERGPVAVRFGRAKNAYLHHPPRWHVTSGVHGVRVALDLSLRQSQFDSVMLPISLTDSLQCAEPRARCRTFARGGYDVNVGSSVRDGRR
jgi:hypothetical protein